MLVLRVYCCCGSFLVRSSLTFVVTDICIMFEHPVEMIFALKNDLNPQWGITYSHIYLIIAWDVLKKTLQSV